MGKKRATVANSLRLLKLPAPVQLALRNKQIDQGHARAILGVPEPSLQLRLFQEIQKNGYSVRKVEEMVKDILSGETVKSGKHQLTSKSSRLPKEYDILRKKLENIFKTKVKMTCNPKGKGRITIPFANEEELEHIIISLDKMR